MQAIASKAKPARLANNGQLIPFAKSVMRTDCLLRFKTNIVYIHVGIWTGIQVVVVIVVDDSDVVTNIVDDGVVIVLLSITPGHVSVPFSVT